MAKANQRRKQAKQTRAKPNPKGRSKKADKSRATKFLQKSKETALKNSNQPNRRNGNFSTPAHQRKILHQSNSQKCAIIINDENIQHSRNSLGTHFKITASSDAKDFMMSTADPSTIPGSSKARSTPRVDKIVDRIWKHNSPSKQNQNDNPIEVVYLDSSNSPGKQMEELIALESTPNEDEQVVEAELLATNEIEEHEGGPPSSISDINRETSMIHQTFDPKILPSGGEGGRCVMEGFQKEHQVFIY